MRTPLSSAYPLRAGAGTPRLMAGSVPWAGARARILKRDPLCTVCGRAPSVEVDHALPRSMGGDHSDANLRGVCRACHLALTRALTDYRARGPRARIVRDW